MKKSLLLLLVAAMVSLSSTAITPQELDGKPVLQLFWGNAYQAYGPTLSTSGVFRYEDGQLYIDGFRRRFTLPVTFDESAQTLILPLQMQFDGEPGTVFNKGIIGATQGQSYNVHYDYVRAANGYVHYTLIGTTMDQQPATCYKILTQYSSVQTTPYSTEAYSYVGLPNFVIDKSNIPVSILLLHSSNNSVNLSSPGTNDDVAVFSKMAFYIMDNTNAHATDSNKQSYDLSIAFKTDSDNEIKLPNIFNHGICYEYTAWDEYYLKWIEGSIDRDNGTITIPALYTGGMIYPDFQGYKMHQSGSYSIYIYPRGTYNVIDDRTSSYVPTYFNGNVPVYDATDPINWTGYWFRNTDYLLPEQILGCELIEDEITDITGTFEVNKVYHETPSNQWAYTAGGELHTYEDWAVKLGKAVFYTQAISLDGDWDEEEVIDWTEIEAERLDVTHYCTVDCQSHGVDENNIYIKGCVNPIRNSHHVQPESYEYYLIPGIYDTPKGDDFTGENGHIDGVNVTEYITDHSGNNFTLLVPVSVFGDKANADGDYTLYVRAKYVADDNLTDTFHALTPLYASLIPTGVENLHAEEVAATIDVDGNTVIIDGSEGDAIIVTPAGSVIYQGGDNAVDVEPGLYIVRAKSTVQKVLVK